MDIQALLNHLRNEEKPLLPRMSDYLQNLGRLNTDEAVSVGVQLFKEARRKAGKNGNGQQLRSFMQRIKTVVRSRKPKKMRKSEQ